DDIVLQILAEPHDPFPGYPVEDARAGGRSQYPPFLDQKDVHGGALGDETPVVEYYRVVHVRPVRLQHSQDAVEVVERFYLVRGRIDAVPPDRGNDGRENPWVLRERRGGHRLRYYEDDALLARGRIHAHVAHPPGDHEPDVRARKRV